MLNINIVSSKKNSFIGFRNTYAKLTMNALKKLPTKVDDRLTDAIVQFRFDADWPFELLVGVFSDTVKDIFEVDFTNFNRHKERLASLSSSDLKIAFNPPIVLSNQKIKLSFQPEFAITFNIEKEYVGWSYYQPLISDTLTKLFNTQKINGFTRIGVRFISQYPGVELFDEIKMGAVVDLTGFTGHATTLRTEISGNGFTAIVQAANMIRIQNREGRGIKDVPTSLLDIDVFERFFEPVKLDEALVVMNNLHQKEKELFFALLKPDFLKSLNPVY